MSNRLQVGVTMNARNLTINNPPTWTCKTFESCPRWKRSQSLYWSNLPVNSFVMFYETNTCHAGGKYTYFSRPGQSSGSHDFQPRQAIRSIMVGDLPIYSRRPHVITSLCSGESATIDAVNKISINASYPIDCGSVEFAEDDGGLTSNWSAVLPDELKN